MTISKNAVSRKTAPKNGFLGAIQIHELSLKMNFQGRFSVKTFSVAAAAVKPSLKIFFFQGRLLQCNCL